MENLLRQLGDSISLLGAILSAPVTIATAIQLLYFGYRRLVSLRKPEPPPTLILSTGSVTMTAMARPAAITTVPPFEFNHEKYERRRRQGRLAFGALLLLAIPAFVISPGTLVIAVAALSWLAVYLMLAFEVVFRDRDFKDENPFVRVVLNAIFLILGAVITALPTIVVAGVGFAIGAIVSVIRGMPALQLDDLDLRITAALLLAYLWILQDQLLE